MAKHQYDSGEWGGYDANVYYSPDECGFKIVASCEKEPGYDFDIVLLLKDKKTGSLWLAHDSGCSCPTEFEDVHSFADLHSLRSERGIDEFLKGHYLDSYQPTELAEFRRKARAAVRVWKKSKVPA